MEPLHMGVHITVSVKLVSKTDTVIIPCERSYELVHINLFHEEALRPLKRAADVSYSIGLVTKEEINSLC